MFVFRAVYCWVCGWEKHFLSQGELGFLDVDIFGRRCTQGFRRGSSQDILVTVHLSYIHQLPP